MLTVPVAIEKENHIYQLDYPQESGYCLEHANKETEHLPPPKREDETDQM